MLFLALLSIIDITGYTYGFLINHFKEIGSGNHHGDEVNFYLAVIIAIFMSLTGLLILIVLIYALFSVKKICSAARGFGVILINAIKDYIYPEEVQDDII